MRVRALLAAGVCGALLLTAPARALEEEDIRVIAGHPSSSPTADEIVFETDFDHLDHRNLWIASMDGKSSRKLVIDCRNPADPAWSPNGRAIAFTCNDEVMSVSPDGSHLTRLGHGIDATWSPDSAQLAFADSGEIGIMNSDGTDRRLVTSTLRLAKPQDSRAQPFFSDHPSFSPGGDKIVFSLNDPGISASLMIVNRDGSALHALTSGSYQDWHPQWSSFGVLFSSNRDSSGHFKPWLIQPDGKELHKLSDSPALDPIFLPSGQVVFGDEMADPSSSQITLLDPRSGIKRSITTFGSKENSRGPAPRNDYLACGCGCCGGEQPQDQCLNRAGGRSLDVIIKEDQLLKNSSVCQVAGCSKGVHYRYCN